MATTYHFRGRIFTLEQSPDGTTYTVIVDDNTDTCEKVYEFPAPLALRFIRVMNRHGAIRV